MSETTNKTPQAAKVPRFRLLFIDPADKTQERARQTFFADYECEAAKRWRDTLFAAAGPDAFVTVYETNEQVVRHYRQPQPSPLKPGK